MLLGLADTRQEPSLTMNHLLAFFVKELIDLETNGIILGGQRYQVRLFCICADDPGTSQCHRFIASPSVCLFLESLEFTL